MALLPLLLAGHLIGDWIVQTDWEAANKTTSWRANQMHVASYHVVLMLSAPLAGLPLLDLAVILAVSWLSHSFIDRRWPVKWLMRHTGSVPFSETTFGVIAVDQALHISILCLLAATFGGS